MACASSASVRRADSKAGASVFRVSGALAQVEGAKGFIGGVDDMS